MRTSAPALLALLLAACGGGPGGIAAAPPAPPPAPAAAAGEARIGPFLIFFDHGESSITPQSRAILERPLARWRSGEAAFLLIEGHADSSATLERSLDVSRRRAWAVHDWLVEAGVPPEAIAVRYHGESRPLVETADSVREPQNRRVEIHLALTREELPR